MDKRYWDRISSIYDIAEDISSSDVYDKLVEEIGGRIRAGAKVLDAAGGTGTFAIAAAKSAGFVVCSDLSTEMLRQAHAKAKRSGIENIGFKTASIYELPFRDNCFDSVIAANVLHLLDDPQRAVDELLRVTKPGGEILLPTFLNGESNRLLLSLYKITGFAPQSEYTFEKYEEFIQSCGIACIEIKHIGGRFPSGLAILKKED